jgi:hypothetical protein
MMMKMFGMVSPDKIRGGPPMKEGGRDTDEAGVSDSETSR